MLSQKGDLLEQPLDFYEPNVLPATQPIVSKHCRKTQWLSRLLFFRHCIIIEAIIIVIIIIIIPIMNLQLKHLDSVLGNDLCQDLQTVIVSISKVSSVN